MLRASVTDVESAILATRAMQDLDDRVVTEADVDQALDWIREGKRNDQIMIKGFFNKLMGLPVGLQAVLFELFQRNFDHHVMLAKQNGKLDRGALVLENARLVGSSQL